jgi:lysophospholipase L1-like esterase
LKWLKKWAYLILLTGTGIGYLAFVDHWQVYAEPLDQVKEWCRELGSGELFGGEDEDRKTVWAPGDARESNSGDGAGTEQNKGDGDPDVNGDNPSENNADSGEQTDNGDSGRPEDMTGSGNTAGSGDMTGSGNTVGSGGVTGSGNAAGSGGITGSGNTAVPGGVTGSGNTVGSGDAGQVEYRTVEDDYFSDAVFIGDSRTVGMFEYGGLEEISAFYASKGLTVYKLFDSEIVSVPGERKKITVEEALQQNSFAKIYLMIGINEMGTGTVESFLEKYQEVVRHLQELQPDAIIYLQAIIKVTAERSAQGDYINNEGIIARNEEIAKLADNEKIFFLDVNPMICDDTGGMIPEYTFDGVHLKAKYIEIWKDFLKTHAISS